MDTYRLKMWMGKMNKRLVVLVLIGTFTLGGDFYV
jgi:hypothetical protein